MLNSLSAKRAAAACQIPFGCGWINCRILTVSCFSTRFPKPRPVSLTKRAPCPHEHFRIGLGYCLSKLAREAKPQWSQGDDTFKMKLGPTGGSLSWCVKGLLLTTDIFASVLEEKLLPFLAISFARGAGLFEGPRPSNVGLPDRQKKDTHPCGPFVPSPLNKWS